MNFTATITIQDLSRIKESVGNPFQLHVEDSIDTTPGSPLFGEVNPNIQVEWFRNYTAPDGNKYEAYRRSQLLTLTTSGLLTASFNLQVYSDVNQSSPQYFGFIFVPVINSSSIDLQSYAALQLEEQNIILQNDAPSSSADSMYFISLVVSLTLVVIAVALFSASIIIFESDERIEERKRRAQFAVI